MTGARKPKLNIVPTVLIADDAQTQAILPKADECAPNPPSDLEMLKQPEQILFVAQSRTYTSHTVPAIIMTYTNRAPSQDFFHRLDALTIDRTITDDKALIEVVFVFRRDPRSNLEGTLKAHPLESARVAIELDKAETDVFFEEFNQTDLFAWSVNSMDYIFTALIDRKSQEVDCAKIELRQLH